MPLFRQAEVRQEREREGTKRKSHQYECDEEDEDEPSSLRRLCVFSLAENMKDVWTQDYANNYMDQYFFRYVMGPFSLLPGDLIEELLCVLSQRKLLSRAALHLLLLPQLHTLSLSQSGNLVTANLCSLITVRCQFLKCLDLSGAQNVSSATLCSLLSDLSCLHSLSLAGTLCDRAAIATVARRCSLLQHLDVSRCLHLPPAALLPLALQGPKRLASLLALDIGLGEHEDDGPASAAFLLLGVSGLQRLAIEGLGHACAIIQNRDFAVTDGFTAREGVPCLGELWDARVQEKEVREDEEDRFTLEEKMDRSLSLDEGRRTDAPRGRFKLRLREVHGLTLDSLDAVSNVCPDVHSVSLNCHDDDDDDDEGSSQSICLTRGLTRWSGQLHFLSLQFSGPLSELVPPLQVSGSCLLSLTLEGLQADGNLPLIALLRACPKLASLTLHIDPPRSNQEEDNDDDDEDVEDWDLPCLPHLRTLTLMFSLEESRLKPVLCWTSLKGVLWSLLRGSVQLHTLSLIATPCRLDPVFRLVLDRHAEPLRRLRRVSLQRSDVTMETATRLVDSCRRLISLDVSSCWSLTRSNVTKLQSRARRRRRQLHITWT
ncbi:uncharacterized protein si:ch211-214j8.12 [Ictalurus punctatus]|uniref:Uncharacterized protein si:ch211-214j8.12 n=1 Tax=Ictalurus punctatus TaxID=7998 RepID=A0A979EJH4_ICTPU|nr:uncharacterized protein si:ch211-214j8.12 [Ictalurus punctatus]XP_047005609.1 uncharacterized protein si:ch211-214j8.12 [Ictalurus punctatus]XP_053530560.1 uncharacterized protein si:ch211-214j8.12 [Ictalurus punctatus]